jgi:hypothetical protein
MWIWTLTPNNGFCAASEAFRLSICGLHWTIRRSGRAGWGEDALAEGRFENDPGMSNIQQTLLRKQYVEWQAALLEVHES